MSPHPARLTWLLLALLLASGGARAQSVLPTGGHVAAGSATIGAPTGNTLSITQTSPRAIVNWNNFSVGSPNTVRFNQPGNSAAILNRVTGATPSTIAGQIDANGQVYLVNPNGVAITPTGNVQVGGGFVASTLGISNQNFMGGNLNFAGNGASAPVSNAGTITAGPGGTVALIGGTAANSGTISVPLGKVALGSGEAATLDLNGGGFLQVAVPTGATTAQGQALVSNSGKVRATGGTVQLEAATVATAIRDAVNLSGVVNATSVSGRNGSITLSGGPGGAVAVSGTADASGYRPGTTGGTVKVTGNRVDLAPTAKVLARGRAGGGTVEIGGGPHGGDPTLANALSTTVEAGARIDASATQNGNGGTVSVWSDGTTVFNGTILADGGPSGGNGGWAETSGHDLGVGRNARVTVGALAREGAPGTWLLDPYDVTITTENAPTLENALSTDNVVVSTSGSGSDTGDITVASAISWGSASTLTLQADNNISINAAITGTSGTLALQSGRTTAGGSITVSAPISVGTFQASSQSGGTILLDDGTDTPLIQTAGGGQSYNAPVVLDANATLADTGAGAIDFADTVDAASAGSQGLTVSTGAAVTFGAAVGTTALASLDVTGGSITVAAPIEIAASGAAALSYSGALTVVLGEGNLEFGAGATLSLNSTAYTLIYNTGSGSNGLQSLNGSSGHFALATPLTYSNTLSAPPVASFSGTFNGLGNTISNLTITDNGGSVGLFGVIGTSGKVSNVGLVGGSVTGAASSATIGELVGTNEGAIANAYATGTVNGGSGSTIDGGLVGSNESTGTITQSYATGAVNGGDNNVGGLVGQNIEGTISDSYATGAVTGGSNGSIGGLVGYNFVGTITASYATGAVGGGSGASVGGLAGTNFFGTITDGFWDSATTGASAGFGSGTDTTSVVNTAGLASAATLAALNSNGVVWGNVNNQTAPYLLNNVGQVYLAGDASATPTAYTLILTIPQFEAIGGSSGHFALADPLDLSSVANWTPLTEGTAYTGTFNGLGNAITGLTINDSTDAYVGLFGQLGTGGTIENVSLSGTVTATAAGAQTGGLVGFNNGGTISNVTSTATVSDNGAVIGGLVGVNSGAIANSSATGPVTGSDSDVVGGLVGENQSGGSIANSFASGAVTAGTGSVAGGFVGSNDGTITDAYAVGAVTAGTGVTGGFAGSNGNTITDAYATGAVAAGGGSIGGFSGSNSGAPFTAAYYDACTVFANCGTGSSALGPQGDGSVGVTTAALQSFEFNDTTYFQNRTNWNIVAGVSYPYLAFEFTGTPQIVAGTVFNDAGVTPAGSGIAVTGLVNGTVFNSAQTGGTVATGANGYYYYLLAPGTLPAGGNVLTYAQNYSSGTTSGAALADQVSGDVGGLDIYGNTLHEITPDTANSVLQANLATALGGNPTAAPLVAGLTNLQIDASGGVFEIDTAISYPSGTVTLNAGGAIIESAGTITANSLAVNAALSVDLPQANAVGTLAANVTGAGSSFDFRNAATLTIGAVGSLGGVTANGTDGSEANIVLQTTAGDIDIEAPVSTNGANGTTLGVSLGEIGLQAAGNLVMNQSGSAGNLVAFAVEAIAGGTIDLDGSANPAGNRIGANDSGGVAQTTGTFSAETTGPGSTLTFTNTNAPLTIDQVTTGTGGGVAAGSITLPLISGVYSNGGEIQIVALQTGFTTGRPLTLNQPVNANNLVGGNPSAVLQSSPGLVQLVAEGGDLTQTSTGVIVAGQLYAESDVGNVLLTAANRLGASDNGGGIAQTAGLLAGYSEGDFKFIDNNAPLTIDTLNCGCLGIFAEFGSIDLATTGAGAITVNKPVNAGYEINIAVAPGYGFTNTATDNSTFDAENGLFSTAGLDTSFSGVPIIILADQMGLSAGTINSGDAVVVLGPATQTNNIVLGAAGSTGTLGLQTADLASIQNGAIQIGYRNPDGTASLTGDITVAGNLSVNTSQIQGLLLITGGSVNETGGAIIGTGSGLELGIIASGTNSLNSANNIGRLAAYIDGTSPSLSFSNAGALRVGALGGDQDGVSLDGNGFPATSVMGGAPSDPLSGITISGGAATTGGVTLTTGAGGITILEPVATGAQPVSLSAVGGIAFNNTVATTGTFSATAGSGGGGAVAITQNGNGLLTLGGSASFTNDSTGGTIALTQANPISGTVSLSTTGSGANASLTSDVAFTLSSATISGNLAVTDTPGLTISGSAGSPGTISLTGPLTLSTGANVAAPTIDISAASSLVLNGAAVLGESGATIDLANAASTGAVTEATTATIIASSLGATNGLTGNASLIGTDNAVEALSAIGVTGSADGFSLVTNSPLSVNGSLTAAGGPVSLIANAGNLTIAAGVALNGDSVVLATSADFLNDAGSGAITATGSRWLIYSAAPAGANFGALNSGNTAIWGATVASLPPASVTQSGYRYLFAQGQTLTVTTTSDSKAYGNDATAQVAGDYTVGGFASGVANAFLGDTAATAYGGTPSVTSAGSAATASVAGGPYPIVAATGSLAALDGYSIAFANTGTLTVTPITLTASIIGSPTKVYDGTTTASLASADFSLSGFVAGQGATVAPLTGSYNSPDVATATTVAASLATGDFTANGGTALGNYTLPTTASGAGAITPATLTASIIGNPTKTYDGTATASLASANFSLSGFVAGQGATVAPLTGSYNTSDVATAATVMASLATGGFTASAGTALGNYTLPTTASGAGAITPASLTASVIGSPTKTYDGTATASLASANLGLSGFVAGQGATVSPPTSVYNSPDVATATTVAASLATGDFTANAGTSLGNYTLPTTASGAGTITPATLIITADNAAKVYGTALIFVPTAFTQNGLVAGDTIARVAFASAGAAATVPVAGSPYTISLSGAAGTGLSNYAIAYVAGTLTVTPAPLTVAADDLLRLVGQPNPPLGYTITLGSLFNGDVLAGAPATSATATSLVGTYPVTQGTLAASPNYTLTFIDGMLTVGTPPSGVSPALFITSFFGTNGWADSGAGGLTSGLTNCPAGSIAALLKGSGKASLYGEGGADCGL